MNRKKNSLCFSGHRSEKLPKTKKGLKQLQIKLNEEIEEATKNGIDTFYFGACYGFDLLCANLVLSRKKLINIEKPQCIKLIAIIPFEEQANRWNDENRKLYFNTLAKCDEVITLNTKYLQGCYHERNRYIVDHSNRLICYYNGDRGGTAYTVNYAIKNNLQIINLFQKTE